MKEISLRGVDCCLCDMPLNFALLYRDAAEDIRAGNKGNYKKNCKGA